MSASQASLVAAAHTVHMGPYDRLHEAHAAVRDWCGNHGRSAGFPNWEVYGHWADDPAQLRTDVYYLLDAATP